MNTDKDGGNAFPIPGLQEDPDFNGLSVRDYFAAKALSGLAGRKFHKGDGEDGYAEWAAAMAYEFADAMLAARGAQ